MKLLLRLLTAFLYYRELQRSVNALLDPGITLSGSSSGDGSDDSTSTGEGGTNYPALVHHKPYPDTEEPRLLFKPAKKRSDGKKNAQSKVKLVSELFTKKKKTKRPSSLYADGGKSGPLRRSNSWDTLQRPNKNKISHGQKTETYVYKSKKRERKRSEHSTVTVDTPSAIKEDVTDSTEKEESKEESQESQEETESSTSLPRNDSQQSIPLRDLEIEEASAYEDPVSILKKTDNVPKPKKPPRRQSAPVISIMPKRPNRQSFSEVDVVIPKPLVTEERQQHSQQQAIASEDVGLLKIRMLVVKLPKDPVRKSYETEFESKELIVPVLDAEPPTEGMLCIFSINGKQSRFESTLQPYIPVKQVAVWDQTDNDAYFYASPSQQLFVMSRNIPLSEASKGSSYEPLSRKPKSECVGVGILPVSNLDLVSVVEVGTVENWMEMPDSMSDVTMELNPKGSVLLGLSYQGMNRASSASIVHSSHIHFQFIYLSMHNYHQDIALACTHNVSLMYY